MPVSENIAELNERYIFIILRSIWIFYARLIDFDIVSYVVSSSEHRE